MGVEYLQIVEPSGDIMRLYEYSIYPKTMADLPPTGMSRWYKRTSLSILNAIEQEIITEYEAIDRYGLSREEIDEWRQDFALDANNFYHFEGRVAKRTVRKTPKGSGTISRP